MIHEYRIERQLDCTVPSGSTYVRGDQLFRFRRKADGAAEALASNATTDGDQIGHSCAKLRQDKAVSNLVRVQAAISVLLGSAAFLDWVMRSLSDAGVLFPHV